MAWLIKQIDVDGTPMCPECEGKRTTAAVISNLQIPGVFGPNSADVSTPCGPWTVLDSYFGGTLSLEGEISLGVACASSVTFTITGSSTVGYYQTDVFFYVDGTYHGQVLIDSAVSLSETYEVTLTGVPCGALITVMADVYFLSDYDFTITAEITAIA